MSNQEMSSQNQFLFQANPDRFQQILTDEDVERRVAANPTVDDLLLCEVVRYGIFNKTEMIGPLAKLYQTLKTKMSEQRRYAVYRHVFDFVENSPVSVNAFLPFIVHEDAGFIAATAVIDYVSLGPLTNDDPMSRVKDIVGMIENNTLKNEAAAFGALLHIGDKRVCDLLVPLRDSLDPPAVKIAVNSGTGFIHSATVEFYLDWLEGLEGTYEDGTFGIVASGLALLKKKSHLDQIATGHRLFPVSGLKSGEWKRSLKPMPLSDYVPRISSRLYALERAEPPPRVMPHVLNAWGLKPLTDRTEVAVLDDRAAITATPQSPSEGRAITPVDQIPPDGRVTDIKGEWWNGSGKIFLIWGILNPNGPTLYTLGCREVDGKQKTFFRWLHMLGGCTTYAANAVEKVTYQNIHDDAQSINKHLPQQRQPTLFKTVPSFVIASDGDSTVEHIVQRLVCDDTVDTDWGREIAYVRKFGTNFFGRAGAELREFYDAQVAEAKAQGHEPDEGVKFLQSLYGHIPDFSEAEIPKATPSPLTSELFKEWWTVVSAPDHQKVALTTLKSMWEGAITMLSQEMKANAVEWDLVLKFLINYRFEFAKHQ
jgi:hypothetical protein